MLTTSRQTLCPCLCRSLARAARPHGGIFAPAKALPAVAARGLSFFNGEPRRASKFDDKLDMSHLLTHSAWTREELDGVEKTHREPRDWVDRAAYYTVQGLRGAFDLCSMYKVRTMADQMHERDWIRRVIFLETVAGVPGMVAGMLRHLHSLRLMRRDYGWIHALLSEAENERMHLLIALSLRQPGPLFRMAVIGGQGVFLTWYSIAYLLCPRYCHRFVGYLEEEAVHTYSKLLEDIDAGKLPMFANLKAPRIARIYYNLPADAMLRDVFERIRADEGAHRDTNHHFGDLKPDEPNTMVEHLRRAHFQHSNVFSGLAVDKELESKEQHDLKTFREQLGTKSSKSAQSKQDPGAV